MAELYQTPYYAVIFSSKLTEQDSKDYEDMAEQMLDLAKKQTGFLGLDSARDKMGITVSYWKDLDSIRQWKEQLDHQHAQNLGREKWYSSYEVRIAKVERDYNFSR